MTWNYWSMQLGVVMLLSPPFSTHPAHSTSPHLSVITNFLTDRRQQVSLRKITSSTQTSNGVTQGCVLSPLLYSLHKSHSKTFSCMSSFNGGALVGCNKLKGWTLMLTELWSYGKRPWKLNLMQRRGLRKYSHAIDCGRVSIEFYIGCSALLFSTQNESPDFPPFYKVQKRSRNLLPLYLARSINTRRARIPFLL